MEEIGSDQQRGYFVSQNEQDAVVGRVVRQYAETSKRYALLVAEAESIGKELAMLASALREHPNRALQDKTQADAAAQRLNIDRIKKLTDEIRQCEFELNALQVQKDSLGI